VIAGFVTAVIIRDFPATLAYWSSVHRATMDGRIRVLTRAKHNSRADFVDHNLRDIGWWVDKHNRYATRQMVDFINREVHLFLIDER